MRFTLSRDQWIRVAQAGRAQRGIMQAQIAGVIWATGADPGAEINTGQILAVRDSVIIPADVEVWARPETTNTGASVAWDDFGA